MYYAHAHCLPDEDIALTHVACFNTMPTLHQVKNRIRAVLLSAKHGCSPRQLLNDYEHFIGESIPYEELGFGSYMDLLQAIPDAVCIVRSRDRTTLYGVPDTSTQHIAKMVSKQRDNPSRAGFDGHGPPRMSMIVSSSRPAANPVAKIPQVPSSFRVQLRSLLLSYPNGILLSDFSEAFARRFAYYCNYKSWGFENLEEVLKSVQDIITLNRDPVRQTLVIKRVTTAVPKKKATETAGEVSTKSANVNMPTKPHPPPVDSLHSIELSPPKKNGVVAMKQQMSTGTRPSQKRTGRVVTNKLIEQVDQLLKANPSGLWVSRFSAEFKEHFKEDLPVSSFGFTSVVHLLSSLPDACKLERPTGAGDWLVYSATKQEAPKVAPDHAVKPGAYFSDELIESIHLLLKNHLNGVPLIQFSKSFSSTLNRDLPVEEIGFHSVVELLQKVPGVMVIKPPDNTQLMVYRTTPLPAKEVDTTETKSGSNTSLSVGTKLTSAYAKQPLPKKSRMCPVYVTHVKTPSCLVVQLLGEKTTKALEFLLEDITQFYNSKDGAGYRVEKIRVGEPCCATFNNDGYWYRCEVQDIPASDIVEVKYIDYGNTAVLPLSSLRRPKPHYLTLPAQAIECRLANLKPPGSTWSRMSTRILFEMTKDKPIVAIITAIKNGMMSVCLCDTNTDKDIHVNDTLVNQGLALFSPDSQEDQARGFDEYNLEPVAVGSTGDKVPEVRMPEDKGRVASASVTPTVPPSLATPTMSALQFPTVSQMNQLQVQNYLQQLLLLQQQQNAFLMNPSTNPMFTQNHLLGQTSQTGQTGFQPSVGMQSLILNPVYPLVTQATHSNPAELFQPVSQDSLNLNSISSDYSDSSSSNKSSSVPPANKAPLISPPTSVQNETMPASVLVRNNIGNSETERNTSSSEQSSSTASVELRSRTGSLEPRSRSASVEPRNSRGGSCEAEYKWKEERRSCNQDKRPLVKRITLTTFHSLSILCHNGRAYFMSCEVSEWFWESDLLKSMLRQVQKQVWGLLLMERKAPRLFHALRECPDTARFVEYEHQLTLYALEDLPLIVSTFHAPSDLCSVVSKEVEIWKSSGVGYFSDSSENEVKELESCLKKLQGMRKEVLLEMMEKSSDDSAIGKAPLEQLIDIEKDIADVKNRLSKLGMTSLSETSEKETATEHAQCIENESKYISVNNTSEETSLSSFNAADNCQRESSESSLKVADEGACNVIAELQTKTIQTPPLNITEEVDKEYPNHEIDMARRNEGSQLTITPCKHFTSNSDESVLEQDSNQPSSDDQSGIPLLQCGNKMLTIDEVVAATSGITMATDYTGTSSLAQTQSQWEKDTTMSTANEGFLPLSSQFTEFTPHPLIVIPTTTHVGQTVVPYTQPQSFEPYSNSHEAIVTPFVPAGNSNRRAPLSIGLGRGLSKWGMAEKPRSIGLGRGLSRGRKPGTQPTHIRYHDSKEGEWQVVSHSKRNYLTETIPPMGSGAGLDII